MEKQQIIAKLIDKSISIVVLLMLSYFLWGKTEKVETQMHKYVLEDRQTMIQAINESTQATRDCVRAIDRNSLIIDKHFSSR